MTQVYKEGVTTDKHNVDEDVVRDDAGGKRVVVANAGNAMQVGLHDGCATIFGD